MQLKAAYYHALANIFLMLYEICGLKVEETFSRYKRIIGNTFKAKHFKGQQNEAKLSLLILNMMKNIGMPFTVRVA